ncbi:MAG: PAS domain-containing protein [Rhodocyclaceae bacterium]|nr:PAS domain-containing protein [Rhodocyclaceae bacterium]
MGERRAAGRGHEGANLGFWDWQADPDVLITNDLWSECGYTREELDALYGNTASRWANMVWPEDMNQAVDAFGKYVNNEIPEHRMELRMKTKSGEPKWILAVGAAVGRDASGKVTRMVGIHHDISERKLEEGDEARQLPKRPGAGTDQKRLLDVDYEDADRYYQSEQAARILGERPTPD